MTKQNISLALDDREAEMLDFLRGEHTREEYLLSIFKSGR